MATGNEQRAERGTEAVRAWMGTHACLPAYGLNHWPLEAARDLVDANAPADVSDEVRQAAYVDVQTEAAEYIGDVLADLLHFGALCGVPVDALLDRARMHFDAAQRGEL